MITPRVRTLAAGFLGASLLLFSNACSDSEPTPTESDDQPKSQTTGPEPAPPTTKAPEPEITFWSDVLLHRAIREKNPGYTGNGQFQINPQGQPEAIVLAGCGVSDLSPFSGLSLLMVDLQACPVEDISPLKGMPLVEVYLDKTNVEDISAFAGNTTLRKLYLNETNVKNLGPLKGLPLEELNLVGARAEDITPLAGMPLKMVWLTGLPVSDISPLATTPIQSLTLHRTKVDNLQPLATLGTLQRLHVGETPVTDLTPITRLPLTRLVFTPATVEKGIEAVRQIPSMQQLGVDFENDMSTLMSPPQFWAKYDAGEFK